MRFLLLSALFICSGAQAATLDADFDVKYTDIAAFYRAVFKKVLDPYVRTSNCADVGTKADARPAAKQYRCGEVPFGRVEAGSNAKQILNVAIPNIDKKDGSVRYKMKATNLKLDLARQQWDGKIDIGNLDTNDRSPVVVSKNLRASNFIGLNPRDGALKIPFCIGLPGLKVKADTVKVDGHVHKSISFWPDMNADLKIKIDLGRADFAVGKICGEIETSFTAAGAPVVKVTGLGNLHLSELDASGLKVKVDANIGGIYGILNHVTKLFGFDLEKIVEKEVKSAVVNLAQDQIDMTLAKIRNGKWIKEYVDKVGLNKVAKRISGELAQELNKLTSGERLEDYVLDEGCRAVASAVPSSFRQEFFEKCSSSVQFDVLFYRNNPEYRAKGCYSYKFQPNAPADAKGQLKWWTEGCALTQTIRVTGSQKNIDLAECLLHTRKVGSNPLTQCAEEIAGVLN